MKCIFTVTSQSRIIYKKYELLCVVSILFNSLPQIPDNWLFPDQIWHDIFLMPRDTNYRFLSLQGQVALISVNALHQIHILIFFLAVFHVIYSAVTMALGRLKVILCFYLPMCPLWDKSLSSYHPMWKYFFSIILSYYINYVVQIRGWKQWEQETTSHDYEFSNGIVLHLFYLLHYHISVSYFTPHKGGAYELSNLTIHLTDPSRFRLTHETSFVRAHTSFWTRIPFFFYIVSNAFCLFSFSFMYTVIV